jgi:U3 small nucleolar RNA-associated protein 14
MVMQFHTTETFADDDTNSSSNNRTSNNSNSNSNIEEESKAIYYDYENVYHKTTTVSFVIITNTALSTAKSTSAKSGRPAALGTHLTIKEALGCLEESAK